ncbi:MAG: HAD family hydrolase [Syntrophobacteraceae bacterium]
MKTVFCDLGNTLVSGTSETPHVLLARRLGLTEKQGKKAGRILMTAPACSVAEVVQALQPILRDHDPAAIANAVEIIWNEQYSSVREIDGARTLFSGLKGSGVTLGLISNTWFPYYQGFRSSCPELSDAVDYPVLSFQLGMKKPSPSIFHYALEIADKQPSECLFIGDSFELDIHPADAAGFQTAWVLSRPEKEVQVITRMLQEHLVPPGIVAENLGELWEMIKEKWL